jgi:hypothetical protein
MRRSISSFILIFCLPVLLGGCLDTEAIRLTVDLEKNEGEIVYLNIISSAKTEEGLKSDFKGLMEMVYGEDEEYPEAAETVSRELYADDGRLSGRTKFFIKDTEKFLKEFGITRDSNGTYSMQVRDGDVTYSEVTGLLPYWEEWRARDSQNEPDAAQLLSKHLGDAIEPMREEGIIDYCPDNTCDSFSTKFSSPGSFHRLADFVYIYLFNISDDPSLEGFRASGKDYISDIVSRNMRECADTSEMENAKCALRNLASAYSIKLKAITYEELDKHEVPIDLESELKRTEG